MTEPAPVPDFLQRLLEQRHFDRLEAECLNILATDRTSAAVWHLLGLARRGMGKLAEALDALEQAARLEPENEEVLAAKAAILLQLGQVQEALESCRAAVAACPSSPVSRLNLGVALEQAGDPAAALDAYDRALALDSEFIPAWLNRGTVLTRLGRLADALENNIALVRRWPEVADFHANCAEVLLALWRPDDALAAASRAAELSPQHAGAHIDRALALSELGRFTEARAAFERGFALDAFALNRRLGLPVDGEALRVDPQVVYLERTYQRLGRCDWAGREDYLATFSSFALEAPERPLDPGLRPLAYHPLSLPLPPEVQFTVARRLAEGFSRQAAGQGPLIGPRSTDQRIRLGYISPDFRTHAVGLLMQDVFRLHDRSRFEVFGYSLVAGDGSDVRRKIESGVDSHRDVTGLSDEAIARCIADDGIDILIDLAGYTDHARCGVFARRPAGIQVNYLGYAASLGAAYIDYAIVDPIVCPPGSERYWTEKLVRLPTAFAPAGSDSPVGPVRSRSELGLPDTGFVYCCFANSYKIDPTVFDTWMKILGRVPGACLWLAQNHRDTMLNLRREAQSRGIDPGRLVFVPLEPVPAYLARYRIADVFLDTRWFNAHTTVMDALRSGVPVLTVAGETAASRLAASVLHALEMPDLIAATLEELEEKAVALALDPGRLDAVRERVKRNRYRAPLFDLGRRVRELEAAYVKMFIRRQRGLQPAAFAVPQQSIALPRF